MDRWCWECTPKHVDSVSQSVHTRVHVSVSVAVGRLAAQKGAWAAASARVAGRASACNIPPSPTLDPSRRVSALGREKVGAQFPRAPAGVGTSVPAQEPLEGTCSLPRADSTHLSSLQIFRRADKNGEFPSHAAPE